jgi:hypothetical protein
MTMHAVAGRLPTTAPMTAIVRKAVRREPVRCEDQRKGRSRRKGSTAPAPRKYAAHPLSVGASWGGGGGATASASLVLTDPDVNEVELPKLGITPTPAAYATPDEKPVLCDA